MKITFYAQVTFPGGIRLAYLLMLTWMGAQGQDLSVSQIPAELVINANAIVRYDETVFKVESRGQAIKSRRYAVTILDEHGEEEHSALVVSYDDFTKINAIEGSIYDASGKKLKSLKSNEIGDYGSGSDGGEISDNRVKYASFGKKSYPYPYTVEFSYETRERNMMFYPLWVPVASYGTAVERASLTIESPLSLPFRHKAINKAPAPMVDDSRSGFRAMRWAMYNVQPFLAEAYSLHAYRFLPMVLTAPVDFEVQKYAGTFTNWQDLGRFYYTLNKDRDALPAEVKTELKRVVGQTTEPQDKVRLLYEWMQSKTRYVSIQLGIGGWQTREASEVATKGYGDCKALSNYMVALLKEAGITAYTALIRAGANAVIESDFPSSQFNHVIVCVPLAADTLWLECTSQKNPFNYLGDFTGNRPALLITPEGGKLVATHRYLPEQNLRQRSVRVQLDPKGDAQVKLATQYYGLQQESRQEALYARDAAAQRSSLIQSLGLAGMEMGPFEVRQSRESTPYIEENMTLNVRQFGTVTGTRLFVKPTAFARMLDVPGGSGSRTTDFYLPPHSYDYEDVDSVTISLPAGYGPEAMPPAQRLESKFGTLTINAQAIDGAIVYTRKLRLQGGRYPAADYAEWLDFVKKVRRTDRAQIVLNAK